MNHHRRIHRESTIRHCYGPLLAVLCLLLNEKDVHAFIPTSHSRSPTKTQTQNILQIVKAAKQEEGSEPETTTTTTTTTQDPQRQLLEQLDDSFDYPGRVQTSHSNLDYSHFRSGYVSVIGAANMGKSTLVNALLEESLCIATRRPQTTRHAILGILTTPSCQLCLMDTPGIVEEAAYQLQEGMMEAVAGALKDTSDALLVVTDLFSTPIPNDELFARVQKLHAFKPTIVVINKIDLQDKVNSSAQQQHPPSGHGSSDDDDDNVAKTVTPAEAVARWRQLLPKAIMILPLSAADGPTNPGVTVLRNLLVGGDDVPARIRGLGRPIPGMFLPGVSTLTDDDAQALLPLGPPLYDEEMYTDRSERFLASEMIRAALLETFQKELPYCCEVQVTSFKEQPENSPDPPKLIKIEADVFVERDSQKAIVIGTQGAKIKEVGTVARGSLEEFFQTKIFLSLRVKVDKDWRKKDDKLKKYGYRK